MRKSEFEKQKTNTYNSADHESVAQNGEKMRKKTTIISAYVISLALAFAPIHIATGYADAAETQVDTANICITENINSNQLMGNITTVQKLPNLHDGILYQLEHADKVELSNGNEGERFNSDAYIYSSDSYEMKAARNIFSGILVAENDIKVSGEENNLRQGIMYTKDGSVWITGNHVTINGIVYAPKGSVHIECQKLDLCGAIITKKLTINASESSAKEDIRVTNMMQKMQKFCMRNDIALEMYFDDEADKIALSDIDAQTIELYIRYNNEPFHRIENYKNGVCFDKPEENGYIEAYVKIVDKYGERRISDIKTFKNEGEGCISEVTRDTDEDGIPDGYEIRDGYGKWNDPDCTEQQKVCIAGKDHLSVEIEKETIHKIEQQYSDYFIVDAQKCSDKYVEAKYKFVPGDCLEAYYNEQGQKVTEVYNNISQKNKIQIIDNNYNIILYNKKGEPALRLAYDGANQIYNAYTYDENGIKNIEHNGIEYDFQYDSEGRIKSFDINQRELKTIEWENDRTCRTTFGDGYALIAEYDSIGDMISLSDEKQLLYSWTYDEDNHYVLSEATDHVNHITYKYTHDNSRELTGMKSSDGCSYSVINDGMNTTLQIACNGNNMTEQFLVDNGKYIYRSNALLEIQDQKDKEVRINGDIVYQESYQDDGSDKLIKVNNQKSYREEYTEQGLLKAVWDKDRCLVSYEYNNLNEVIRENLSATNKTYVYHYDEGGNITNVYAYPLDFNKPSVQLKDGKKIADYGYNDRYADQMTLYQGKQICYDASGNPITYWDDSHFTWTQGNKLKSIKNNNGKTVYSYDMNGNRVKKSGKDGNTQFYYVNGKLIGEVTDKDEMWFHYNAFDQLVGFESQGKTYLYRLNGSNDVVGIMDSEGKELVTYEYDAWGNIVNIIGNQTLAERNPYRYRSYYYDRESGFYYLVNRYYDPATRRMLSMDSYTDTGFGAFSHNMYAYCENTPVNASNATGNVPDWVKKFPKSPSGKNYYWKGVNNFLDSNCYGFAMNNEKAIDPGHYSNPTKCPATEKQALDYTMADLKKLKYKIHKTIPHGDASKYNDDYTMIILRTGKMDNGLPDYHFMKRFYSFSTGTHFWAHKPGRARVGILIYADRFKNSLPWKIEWYFVKSKKWDIGGGSYTSSLHFIVFK